MHLPRYDIVDFATAGIPGQSLAIERFEDMPEVAVETPHQHRFYEILLVDRGRSRQVIDYQEYTVSAGSIFFISPGQVHLFEEYSNVAGFVLLFTEDALATGPENSILQELLFTDNIYSNPRLKLSNKQHRELLPSFHLLHAESLHPSPDRRILNALLLTILYQIQRLCEGTCKPVGKAGFSLFKRFTALLEMMFRQQSSASYYARSLHVTTHHLSLICNSVAGKPASAVIHDRVMLEAKRLLGTSDAPVGRIADELGFADVSYFTRAFRRCTGSTPAAFRKAMSEKYHNKA